MTALERVLESRAAWDALTHMGLTIDDGARLALAAMEEDV